MELKDTIDMMNSDDFKERFRAVYSANTAYTNTIRVLAFSY